MKKTENKKTKVKGNKKPFFTISKKILALSLLPMIIVCALVATVGAKALETGIEKQIEQSLQIVGVSVDETYTNLYEGDYTRDKGGKVRKGGTSISGETQLIDGLQEKTGFQVSFLYGNMRLITTLTKPEGGRINGTALEDDVYAQIQNNILHLHRDCILDILHRRRHFDGTDHRAIRIDQWLIIYIIIYFGNVAVRQEQSLPSLNLWHVFLWRQRW